MNVNDIRDRDTDCLDCLYTRLAIHTERELVETYPVGDKFQLYPHYEYKIVEYPYIACTILQIGKKACGYQSKSALVSFISNTCGLPQEAVKTIIERSRAVKCQSLTYQRGSKGSKKVRHTELPMRCKLGCCAGLHCFCQDNYTEGCRGRKIEIK